MLPLESELERSAQPINVEEIVNQNVLDSIYSGKYTNRNGLLISFRVVIVR